MVKKWAFITLTVSDLAAAPSHSLHRTLAALPGPGSAHHVALSSPRRRRSPGARCVGSCWLRLEVALPGEDHPQLRLAGVDHDRDRLRQRCRGWVRGAGKRHGRTATERRRRASGRTAGSVNPCRPAVYHSRSEHSRRAPLITTRLAHSPAHRSPSLTPARRHPRPTGPAHQRPSRRRPRIHPHLTALETPAPDPHVLPNTSTHVGPTPHRNPPKPRRRLRSPRKSATAPSRPHRPFSRQATILP